MNKILGWIIRWEVFGLLCVLVAVGLIGLFVWDLVFG